MFIKGIQLENYKCFEKQTFRFEKQFTTIIGDNGSGKTALLDGIARGLTAIVDELNPNKNFHKRLNDDEIRTISHQLGSQASLEKARRCDINLTLNNNLSWDFFSGSDELNKYIYELKNAVSDGKPIALPIIVYYKTSRHWGSEQHKEVDLYKVGSRLDSYNTSLDISTSYKTLLEWFKRMELIAFQRRKNVPEIQAVREAIIKTLESLRPDNSKKIEVYFSAETDELMVNIGDGKEFPIRMLSDGYRNTLGMIADIAYRMAELNPHLTTDSPGVVLIDELDLHLHPKWQRHIVGDLKRIFPNCQFIVTTHSPFIIQSLKSGELLKLGENSELEQDDFTTKSIEDIAEEEQGVEMPQRSIYLQEKYDAAKAYYQKLETMNGNMTKEEKKQLREKLALLTERYADDVAYLAFLEQKRLVKEAQIQK